MRKIVILFLFIIACSMAYASIDSSAECQKKSCIEGSMVKWTVPVYNNINKTIIVEYINIIDSNSISIAFYDAEKDKTLNPGESYTYVFDTLITAPPSGYTWYYKPCMRIRIEGSSKSGLVCRDAVKSFTVLPISKAGCIFSSDCAINEECDKYTQKCKLLECGEDQAIKNHECISKSYLKTSNLTRIIVWAVVIAALIISITAIIVLMRNRKPTEIVSKNKNNKKKAKKQRK